MFSFGGLNLSFLRVLLTAPMQVNTKKKKNHFNYYYYFVELNRLTLTYTIQKFNIISFQLVSPSFG